jgi:acyl-coenzyme A synthetase/AMP-(fatty) acid ligase
MPLGALRTAIEATASAAPDRAALAAEDAVVSYGELAAVLPRPVEREGERRCLEVIGRSADIVALLVQSCAGHSVLVLDGKATLWEADRTRTVFGEGPGPEAPAIGLCTSGTNGLPKVVELDWESLLSNAGSFAAAAGYHPHDTIWVTTPLAHLYGLMAGAVAGLLSGATVLMSTGALGPGEFAEQLVDQRVSVLLSVPFLARRYLQELGREPGLRRSIRLRATIAAGEPVAEELVAAWAETTGTPLLAHYGLTEGGHVTLASGGAGEGVGRPLEDVEVQVADGGAIHVRRRAPAQPYRVIGEAPQPGGWCVTGDLGHLDQAGNLHITGRANDRINVAGKKVDPSEVEHALRTCRGVADCAVAGIRRPDGEQVVAFVSCAQDVPDAALRAELGTLLSPYKLPRRFVRVETIPRTLTGKVRRGQLVAAFENNTLHSQREDTDR